MSLPEIPRWPKISILWDPDEEERALQQLNDSRRARGLEPFGRELLGERSGDADMAPVNGEDSSSPSIKSREPQPAHGNPDGNEVSLYELATSGTVTDADEETFKAGDQLANQKVMTKNRIFTFHAFYKNDAVGHGGRQEHARHGPGGSYHLHLRMKGKNGGKDEEVRISTEDWKPLPGDEEKFTREFKAVIDGLSDDEKRYLHKANREVFHKGKVPPGLIMNMGLKNLRGIVLPRAD